MDPKNVYITNAVKHFKFIERGKRRIHARPRVIEMRACEPWLHAELKAVRPALVVALGARATEALLGKGFRVTVHRGKIFSSELGVQVMPTVHPSSILRSPDDETAAS